MKKAKYIIALATLTMVVCLTACGVNMNSEKYVTNTYEISDKFSAVRIDADSVDVTVLPSEDGKCKVVCSESETNPNKVGVQDGTLTIEQASDGGNTINIETDSNRRYITVYLPEQDVQSLNIKESSGDIELNNLVISGAVDMETSSGDVVLNDCDADTLTVTTSSGDVTGTLLSGKNFTADSSSGDVEVPEDSDGGQCTVRTSSGDIKIEVK